MKSNAVFLRHVLSELEFLGKETRGLAFKAFMGDERLTRACARSLEVIGEAVKHLDAELTTQHPDIEWKKLAGLRDKIIHQYFGVNWDIVWDVIQTKLPGLKAQIEQLLRHCESEEVANG